MKILSIKVMKAEDIYNILDTRSFRSRKPPVGHVKEAIVRINYSLESNEPVQFTYYWGQGSEELVGTPEFMQIKFLRNRLAKIAEEYAPGVLVNIIFCDTHINWNGIKCSKEYLTSLEYAFDGLFSKPDNLNFQFHLMSKVANYTMGRDGLFTQFRDYEKISSTREYNDEEKALLKIIYPMAEKHNKRIKSPELAGKVYFEMNIKEKEDVERVFPNSTMITNNAPEFSLILPKPIFCSYSIGKGLRDKSWFVDGDSAKVQQLLRKHSHIANLYEKIHGNKERAIG